MTAHAFFSGTVQGVGFRYTCRSYAVEMGLSGWVKNLSDGRVELWAEGDRVILEDLIRRIKIHFDGYIRDVVVDFHEAASQYSSFQVVV